MKILLEQVIKGGAVLLLLALLGCSEYKQGDCVIIASGDKLVPAEFIKWERQTIWTRQKDGIEAVGQYGTYISTCESAGWVEGL